MPGIRSGARVGTRNTHKRALAPLNSQLFKKGHGQVGTGWLLGVAQGQGRAGSAHGVPNGTAGFASTNPVPWEVNDFLGRFKVHESALSMMLLVSRHVFLVTTGGGFHFHPYSTSIPFSRKSPIAGGDVSSQVQLTHQKKGRTRIQVGVRVPELELEFEFGKSHEPDLARTRTRKTRREMLVNSRASSSRENFKRGLVHVHPNQLLFEWNGRSGGALALFFQVEPGWSICVDCV